MEEHGCTELRRQAGRGGEGEKERERERGRGGGGGGEGEGERERGREGKGERERERGRGGEGEGEGEGERGRLKYIHCILVQWNKQKYFYDVILWAPACTIEEQFVVLTHFPDMQ